MQSLAPHPNAAYKNLIHAMKCMVKREGILTPFRGINIVAVGAGPAHAMYFSCYEAVKKCVNKDGGYNPVGHGRSSSCCPSHCSNFIFHAYNVMYFFSVLLSQAFKLHTGCKSLGFQSHNTWF